MTHTNPDILAIGETMIELTLLDQSAAIGVAGDSFNTAVYVKRSAPNLSVGYVTRLGRDPMSDRIVPAMRAENLDVTHVAQGDGLPGLYSISTDDRGERSFHYWRSVSAARDMFAVDGLDLAAMSRANLVYFSAISLAILPTADRDRLMAWLADVRASGTKIAFDSNFRPALWPDITTAQRDVERAWRLTDIGLPSVDDEIALFGDTSEDEVVRRLNNWGVISGALKRGARGPRPLNGSAAPDFEPAQNVVDTTAAGDSFNGGFLAANLSGDSTHAAMQAGHDLACRVIGARGAILPKDPA